MMEHNSTLNGIRKVSLLHGSDHCGPTAKRISLKALTNCKEIPSANVIFQSACEKLSHSTKCVLQSQPVESTLEELYRNVEDVCSQKMVAELYAVLKAIFSEYVRELLPHFLKESFHLGSVATRWEVYCQKMLLIRNIFLYMDRQLLVLNAHCLPIWDLALKLFCEEVVTREQVQNRILSQILEEIDKERHGEVVDRQLLRTVVRMFINLKLYEPVFLPEFLRKSQQLYDYEAHTLSRQLDISDYLIHVDKRIVEEEERLVYYLDENSTRTPLINTLVSELLTRPLDYLLENGLVGPLKNKQTNQLSLFYSLLLRVAKGVDKLRTHFRAYIIKRGQELVNNPTQDPEKDRIMIHSLLECRDFLCDIIRSCFGNDASFMRVLQEAYEEFINQRPNKPAEFLAKYLDSHLRAGNKAQTEEELDRLMDKVMILFRFIDGKDIFEAFYSKELAKRLLLNKSASVDAEKAMLSKFKQECGPNYTRKMETMFQDIELSKQLSKHFRNSLPDSHTIELSVNVICLASWPPYPQTTANYPPDMASLREEFTRFYLSRHQGRKLTYEPTLGTCVVKARFPVAPSICKELQVSELQALVLLQFNGPAEQPITYTTIAENTNIEEKELMRTLLSLVAGKGQRILIKKPASLVIENDHEFTFNTEFRHRLTRIKFNQIQLKETVQEQEATEERVFADRVAHVDCCIVRIMKTRKTVDHNTLLSEVFKQLQFPLKASDIKKRIENLIERDYMKRDPGNVATYHYIS